MNEIAVREYFDVRQKMPAVELSRVDFFDARQIFECGQCFRFDRLPDGRYEGVAKGKYLCVGQPEKDRVLLIGATLSDYETVWRDFFALDEDYAAIQDDIYRHFLRFGSVIREAVQSQIEKYDWDGGADVLVYVPQGVEIAKKTFNPRLGIEGGISVLGTSGIVEPMSEQALTQTIFLEMKMLRDEGHRYCYLTPGNYGNDFLRQTLGYDQELAVKCSNYIGDAIDDGVRLKMDGLLLVGHIGKLVKIAAGVMNTHSRQADARMEVLAVHAAMAGADRETVCALMKCFTTKEALDILEERGLLEETMQTVMEKIEYHLAKRAGEKMKVGALMFSDELGVLGKTSFVDELRKKIG